MREKEYGCSIPVDLERHLKNLAESYPEVRELHSLWLLLRKRIEEELTHCGSIFVNYSLHDGSHSRTVIQAVERFLGEERICRLSATDTFIHMENIRRLPHRIVRIEAIMQNEHETCYDLRLQSVRQQIESITMSEETCLYDYMGAFDFYTDNLQNIQYDSLEKRYLNRTVVLEICCCIVSHVPSARGGIWTESWITA